MRLEKLFSVNAATDHAICDGLPGHRAIGAPVLLDAADAIGDCPAPHVCACVRVGPDPGLAADRADVADAQSGAADGGVGPSGASRARDAIVSSPAPKSRWPLVHVGGDRAICSGRSGRFDEDAGMTKKLKALPPRIYVKLEADVNDPRDRVLVAAETFDELQDGDRVGVYELIDTRTAHVKRELK
jgi:hypothetical protein